MRHRSTLTSFPRKRESILIWLFVCCSLKCKGFHSAYGRAGNFLCWCKESHQRNTFSNLSIPRINVKGAGWSTHIPQPTRASGQVVHASEPPDQHERCRLIDTRSSNNSRFRASGARVRAVPRSTRNVSADRHLFLEQLELPSRWCRRLSNLPNQRERHGLVETHETALPTPPQRWRPMAGCARSPCGNRCRSCPLPWPFGAS